MSLRILKRPIEIGKMFIELKNTVQNYNENLQSASKSTK